MGNQMAEQETSSSEKDWGNLRFTPRRDRYAEGAPEDNANARFVIGLAVVVLVALLYPWYSYWVQTHLLARELQQATQAIDSQLRHELRGVGEQVQQAAAQSQQAANRRRARRVRVMGAMTTNGVPVVIVDMGEASLSQSTVGICRQAPGWLGRPVSGLTLQVEAWRRRAPAESIGSVVC